MKYLLLTTIMAVSLSLFGQRKGNDKDNRGERVEQQKIAFITEKLDLTIEEAQSFWPIYNKYQNDLKDLRKSSKRGQDLESVTDAEANALLQDAIKAKQQATNLEVDFIHDLNGVLPAKKQLQLLNIGREFKRSILKTYKKRMKSKEKRKSFENDDK